MSGDMDLTTVEPAAQLEAQLGTDEQLEWVVERKMRDVYLGAIGSFIGGLIFGLFLAMPSFFVAVILTRDPILSVGAAVAVLVGTGVLMAAWTLINGMMSTIQYAATDERFIALYDTLTSTNTESVSIDRVRDVEYSEDLADKLFGTGDITIEAQRGSDSLVFQNVTDEQTMLKAVRQQAEI